MVLPKEYSDLDEHTLCAARVLQERSVRMVRRQRAPTLGSEVQSGDLGRAATKWRDAKGKNATRTAFRDAAGAYSRMASLY